MRIAKIFINGCSQAVRLPKECRFTSSEVSVTPLGKGLVLQPILKTWQEVFTAISPTDDFFIQNREDFPIQERSWKMFE